VLSAKLDQLRLDGNLHNPAGCAFAVNVINTCDEFAKRSGSLAGSCLHKLKLKEEARLMTWGIYPMDADTLSPYAWAYG